MENLSDTRHQILTLVNQQLQTEFDDLLSAVRLFETRFQAAQSPLSFCGTPCNETCYSCTQTMSSLADFFRSDIVPAAAAPEPSAPPAAASPELQAEPAELPEVMVMAYAGDEEDEELERARALDEIEAINNAVYSYEQDYDDDGYDNGYGLDWNESGYFD